MTWFFPFFKKKNTHKRKGKNSPSSLLSQNPTQSLGVLSLFKKAEGKRDLFLSSLEETLLTSDVSVPVTKNILNHLQKIWTKEVSANPESVVKDYLSQILIPSSFSLKEQTLNILFIFGVNGVGKTTTIAKLANYYKQEGKTVALVAADTYRAAAAAQLKDWATRLDIPIVMHEGKSKPSAVLYDALDSAIARKYDVLLVDTAGRLHNRGDLLEELSKLSRIIENKVPLANVKNLLVLDGTMGQNALEQAKEFRQYIDISGVILSKWDSSGKGGVVFSLAGELSLPVYFLGVGEKSEDLLFFDPDTFLSHLFSKEN